MAFVWVNVADPVLPAYERDVVEDVKIELIREIVSYDAPVFCHMRTVCLTWRDRGDRYESLASLFPLTR